MIKLVDKEGFPLRLDTHLSRVNLEVSDSEAAMRARYLEAWDATKPNLGTMDQMISFGRLVPDPALQNGSPIVYVTRENWIDRWDREKPDLGIIEL